MSKLVDLTDSISDLNKRLQNLADLKQKRDSLVQTLRDGDTSGLDRFQITVHTSQTNDCVSLATASTEQQNEYALPSFDKISKELLKIAQVTLDCVETEIAKTTKQLTSTINQYGLTDAYSPSES